MRKTIKTLILMILLILMTFSVNAQETTATMDLKSVKEVYAGEEFTVTLSVTATSGINGVIGKVTYDKDKVELKKIETADSKWFNFGSAEEIEVINATDSKDIKSGDIIKVTFKVKDDLKKDTKITVGVADMELSTLDKEEYDKLGTKNVEVVVKEKTTGDENEDPAGDQDEDPAGDTDKDKNPAGDTDKDKNPTGNTGNKDNTTAKENHPNTGLETLIVPAIIIVVLGVIAYVGNKKYKNI